MPEEEEIFETEPIGSDDLTRRKDWIAYEDKCRRSFGEKLNTRAEQYNAIFTAIFGIYTVVLAFFGLTNADILLIKDFPFVLVFLLPVVFYILGTACLLLVTKPSVESVVQDSTESYILALDNTNLKKAYWFRWGIILFAIGLVMIFIPVIVGSAYSAPTQPGQNVQFVVSEEGVTTLRDVPLEFVSSNKTIPLVLVNTTDTAYIVRLKNGDRIDLKKEWVKLTIINESGENNTTSPKPGNQ